MHPQLSFWLLAHHLRGVGARKLLLALELFSNIEAFFTASQDRLKASGFTAQQIKAIKQADWQGVEKDLAWQKAQNDRTIVCIDDPLYPDALKQTAYPPLIVYAEGNSQLLKYDHFAIVGSRCASAQGKQNAHLFAKYLASAGLSIVSGLAEGIDGAAHQGALDAGGATIAILGSGLNHIYPHCHLALVKQIKNKGGLLLSEFHPDVLPKAKHFPQRNRIIAGLSVGVLIVEAATKSGSLITAKYALEYNREIFALPGSIHQPLAKGCHFLIKQGAKLVETAGDILEELKGIYLFKEKGQLVPSTPILGEVLSVQETRVLDAIDYETTSYDVITLRSRLTASEVSSILLALELQGHIQAVVGGYTRKSEKF